MVIGCLKRFLDHGFGGSFGPLLRINRGMYEEIHLRYCIDALLCNYAYHSSRTAGSLSGSLRPY